MSVSRLAPQSCLGRRLAVFGALADNAKLPPYPTSLAGTLLTAREAVMAPIRPKLREAGVTDQQWRVLRVLADAGSLDAGRIAETALLHAPTVTRILRELTQRGLLHRAPDPNDGRRTVVTIAERGLTLVNATASQTVLLLGQYEAAFGQERLANLIAELSALSAAIAPFVGHASAMPRRRAPNKPRPVKNAGGALA